MARSVCALQVLCQGGVDYYSSNGRETEVPNATRCERRESSVRGEKENKWKCVTRVVQGGIKGLGDTGHHLWRVGWFGFWEETLDAIFEEWVGLGFDRKHEEEKGAETPTGGTPPPYLSGQTAGLPAAGGVDGFAAISQ